MAGEKDNSYGVGDGGDALGNCEGLGYLLDSRRCSLETRFASGSAQTSRLLIDASSGAITKPSQCCLVASPPPPNPIGINQFIHRIPGIYLFLGISGEYLG